VSPSAKPARVGFLLLPQFSLMALSGALELLREANAQAGKTLFETALYGTSSGGVESAGGAVVQTSALQDASNSVDAVFVVSEVPLPQTGHDEMVRWLAMLGGRELTLGGIGTGAFLLGRAGLLNGYRATIHWPYAALLAEEFPACVVSSNLYEIDRDRVTAAGGTASFDMMLTWIGTLHGEELVSDLMDHFGHERQRGGKEHQRVPLAARIGGGQPKLTEAVSLMEANYEEPLPTEDIARLVGVSRRQLERLFKQYLNSLPSRYYLELRLMRARQLLQQTSQSILQIGLSCGFSSGPHFSSAYRNHFGITPREQRTQRLAPSGVKNIDAARKLDVNRGQT
jgi:AraC family transcriptional regulator, L-arginine-responsive activator